MHGSRGTDISIAALAAEIVELQTRLQFQDDYLHKLDDELIRQGRQLDDVLRKLANLEDKLAQLQYEGAHPLHPANEKPPHY